MADEKKTLGERMTAMWDKMSEPSKPGVEFGADLQAQAAAYDYAVRGMNFISYGSMYSARVFGLARQEVRLQRGGDAPCGHVNV